MQNVKDFNLHGIIAVGGEGTLSLAKRLHEEVQLPVVGVPKTIDNDVSATDETFGFDTAVSIATEAIDRLRTTAESHHRALVVEVMGRHAGWIALHSGLAGGANVILVPETPFSVDKVVKWVQRRFERQYAPIIVVAEGAMPEGGAFWAPEVARRDGTFYLYYSAGGPEGEEHRIRVAAAGINFAGGDEEVECRSFAGRALGENVPFMLLHDL